MNRNAQKRRLFDVQFALEVIRNLSIFAGAVFAYVQYESHKQTERVKNTLEFTQRYQNAHLSKSRLSLLKYWLDKPIQNLSNASGGKEVIGALATNHIFPDDTPSNIDDLIIVIDFFDILATCLNEGVCEDSINEKHLAKDARNFYCLYQAPIQRLKIEYEMENFGNATEERFTKGNPCDASQNKE